MGIYRDLEVTPIINAAGEVTWLGGSIMLPEVRAAMDEAARAFVVIDELQRAAGEVIAAATGAEAGFVTAGAAAGLTLAAAACLTGTDPLAIGHLPDTAGRPDAIVVEATHRNWYDRCLRAAGARVVTAGGAGGCTPADFAAALGPETAAVAWFSPYEAAGLPLATVAAIAHARGLPVIVDASLALPPAENLTRFTRDGADLVAFSAGKAMRGPQAAGLLAGRADLIRAAAMQTYDMGAHPDYPRLLPDFPPEERDAYGPLGHGIGRAMKVGKEEIAGAVAALRAYQARDHAAERGRWLADAEAIAGALAGIPGVAVAVLDAPPGPPRVRLTIDGVATACDADAAYERLRAGAPRVFVQPSYLYADDPVLGIAVTALGPGEAAIVAARVRAVLWGGA